MQTFGKNVDAKQIFDPFSGILLHLLHLSGVLDQLLELLTPDLGVGYQETARVIMYDGLEGAPAIAGQYNKALGHGIDLEVADALVQVREEQD